MFFIFELKKGYGFKVSTEQYLLEVAKIEQDWEKQNFIIATSPRVRVLGDTKKDSDEIKNVRVEFSNWVYPIRYFLWDQEHTVVIHGIPYVIQQKDLAYFSKVDLS
jgi:hypothetical protein